VMNDHVEMNSTTGGLMIEMQEHGAWYSIS
jgi:hypothetical protein